MAESTPLTGDMLTRVRTSNWLFPKLKVVDLTLWGRRFDNDSKMTHRPGWVKSESSGAQLRKPTNRSSSCLGMQIVD